MIYQNKEIVDTIVSYLEIRDSDAITVKASVYSALFRENCDDILQVLFVESVIGECNVTERASGRILPAKITYNNKSRQQIYTVRLASSAECLGHMILSSYKRPRGEDFEQYIYSSLFGQRYLGVMQIDRIFGQTTKGAYSGAGSALVRQAAKTAAQKNYALITKAVGDSHGFYRKVFMVKDRNSDYWYLDKQGWEHYNTKAA